MKKKDDSIWSLVEGFEWDEGNIEKNKIKHNVDQKECELTFYDPHIVIFDDKIHSQNEIRFGAIGKSKSGRLLTIFFTIRNNKIRIISARDQSKKEKKLYTEENSKVKIKNSRKYENEKTTKI